MWVENTTQTYNLKRNSMSNSCQKVFNICDDSAVTKHEKVPHSGEFQKYVSYDHFRS